MIQHFDRLYLAARQVMRAMLHCQSRNDLLNDVSQILVEYGGFAMAAVAWHDSSSRELVPVARYGDSKRYLDRIRMFADERPEGMGAAGTAFREGRAIVVNDWLNDPRSRAWAEPARASGWRASAAIPFQVSGITRGVLGVYSTETGFFGTEEQEMLEQVAQDLGFALANLEKEEERRHLEASLAASDLRLKLALAAGQIGIFDWDVETNSVIWDGHTERLFGYEAGQFDGTYAAFESRLHKDEVARMNSAIVESRDMRVPLSIDYRVVWPDGSMHWLCTHGEFSFAASGHAIRMLGAVVDITTRKQAEEERKQADERFRRALDGMLEGCMLIDFKWTYLYVNEAAARHGLQQRDYLIGKTMLDVYPGIENSDIFARYERCMHERTPQHFESSFKFANDIVRWYKFSVSPVPEGIFVLSLDITLRKETEAALQESEERLRQALRVASIGIFELDHRRGTVYSSPLQLAIHGFSPNERVELQSYLDRVHPEDRERLKAAAINSQEPSGDGSVDAEYRLVMPDGAVRWISGRAQTCFEGADEDRRAVRTVGATKDITRAKQAQEEQTKLAALVAMSRDFIGLATPEGKVAYLNPAALSMVGIETLGQAQKKNIAEFMTDMRTVEELLTVLSSEGYWNGETQLRHFGGAGPIDVEVTAFTIRDDLGRPLYLATVTRDIRERRKAEAAHGKLEAQLAQAAKMESIGRLAGGVAHDFNNMLTVILGYAAMCKESTALAEEERNYLVEIEKAANRSQKITRQLLAFSRRQIIQPIPSNLNDLVADLLQPLTRLIGEDIKLSFHPTKELWKVVVDPSQVNQILLNIVVNARDAMPTGGALTIETANVTISEEYCSIQPGAAPGPHVLLTVNDTGVGMSKETMAHIFEPFFTTKEPDKGTGLGLATVFGIVKQNNGFVNVYSEPAHGTTFKIYLPKMPGEAIAPEAIVDAGAAPSGDGTVLLVEDDDLVRELSKCLLDRLGYTPLVARDPQQAIELCSGHSEIRLMLSDVVMPGMNGMELWGHVQALIPGIKVLFMSGYTPNVILDHGVLKEGVNLIQKPFTMDDLGRRLEEVLKSDHA
jgi:two-component system, cell cycle sensor histidine kinase and response regulator CckA